MLEPMQNTEDSQFSTSYSDYWRSLTADSASDTGVPDREVAKLILSSLMEGFTHKNSLTLDAACGSGRLFPVLRDYSTDVDGIEIESSAAENAARFGYRNVYVSPIENFQPVQEYGLIMCWAAFEVLQQEKALHVFSQALASGGYLILTAKSSKYPASDSAAVRAEAGAARKGFVQNFIDTDAFANAAPHFGLEILRTLTFEKRGDFAKCNYEKFDDGFPSSQFYEFAVIFRRTSSKVTMSAAPAWSSTVSKTFQEILESRV